MGEIGSGAGSSFPATLDTDNTKENTATSARPDVPNDLADCIIKIQTALGTSPQGNYSDTKTRLNNTNSPFSLVIAPSGYPLAQNANYVCDGISDEDTILTAINALPADVGGRISLREGVYLFHAELVKDSFDSVIIEGCGKATKIQRGFESASAKGLFDITNCNNWVFRNMWIDGQSATYISTNNRGINIGIGCTDSIVDGVVFSDMPAEALYINPHATTDTSQRGKVTNCFFSNVNKGIYLYRAKDISIIGNSVASLVASGNGIYLTGDSNNNIIIGNVIRNATAGAVAMYLSNASRNVIIGNEILDDSGGNIGINIRGNCDSNIVAGNFIRDFDKNIYCEGSGSEDNFIALNYLRKGTAIYVTDAGNKPYCVYNYIQSGTISDSNKVGHFLNYNNNIAPATITVGASAYNYQNTNPYPLDVIVNSGTVSLIEFSKDGSTYYTTGLTAGIFRVHTYDSLRTTYTVAPSMVAVAR